MSAQWEVVGKKKEKGQKTAPHVNGKEIKKTDHVKIEDILAKSQVKNLYATEKNKIQKVSEKKPEVKAKPQKKAEKTQEAPKGKPPKSIESALGLIDEDAFKGIYEQSKSHFPDAPIVWLKELAQYLNQKVPIEVQDPVFSKKPKNYPLNVVPLGIKAVIENATKEANLSNMQLFFDISISSMVNDMSKNQSALGHKIFLQYIALTEPKLVVANLSKHIVLRNSYQNRPNIGMSILWALAQTGFTDIQSGLKVFEDLMFPLIEMKSYSRYIVKYLLELLSGNQKLLLTNERLSLILDIIYSNKKNVPTDLQQDLLSVIPILKTAVLQLCTKDKCVGFVDYYLRRITQNADKSYQDCLCDIIIQCFVHNHESLESWAKSYAKNIAANAVLLRYLSTNWKIISRQINTESLKEQLLHVDNTNEELLLKKKREDGLNEASALTKSLLENMARNTSSGCCSRRLVLVLMLLVGGLVYLDIKQQGSWHESRVRQAIKSTGLCEYTCKLLNRAKEGLLWVDAQIENKYPGYYKSVNDISQPYVELLINLKIVACNIANNVKEIVLDKYPVVVQSIESYAPGLIEQSQKVVQDTWSTSVLYMNRSINYLKTEVFVGQLSPENMQRVVVEALNTTQIKATEYYHWIYEKVSTAVK